MTDDEQKIILLLADHYDNSGHYINFSQITEEVHLEVDAVQKFLHRMSRYNLVESRDLSNSMWEIKAKTVEIAHQIRSPEPRDYWKGATTWFRSRWWSLPVLMVFVGLPIIVTYIQMLVTILKWFGVLESE